MSDLPKFLNHMKSAANADDFFKWKENIILFCFLRA